MPLIWSRSPVRLRDSDDEEIKARGKAIQAVNLEKRKMEEKGQKRELENKRDKAEKHNQSRSKRNSSDKDEVPTGSSWLRKVDCGEAAGLGLQQDKDEIGPIPKRNSLTSDPKA